MRSPLLDRDRLRLAGLHPDLVRVVERARLAVPFIVVEGLRARERQERLVAIGRMAAALLPHRGRPLYLTVDLDWFDPAVMPGTGTPEPGGFHWGDFAVLVEELRHHRLVGADVVELAPQLDPSGVSAVLAAKVVRSLLLLLGGEG